VLSSKDYLTSFGLPRGGLRSQFQIACIPPGLIEGSTPGIGGEGARQKGVSEGTRAKKTGGKTQPKHEFPALLKAGRSIIPGRTNFQDPGPLNGGTQRGAFCGNEQLRPLTAWVLHKKTFAWNPGVFLTTEKPEKISGFPKRTPISKTTNSGKFKNTPVLNKGGSPLANPKGGAQNHTQMGDGRHNSNRGTHKNTATTMCAAKKRGGTFKKPHCWGKRPLKNTQKRGPLIWASRGPPLKKPLRGAPSKKNALSARARGKILKNRRHKKVGSNKCPPKERAIYYPAGGGL